MSRKDIKEGYQGRIPKKGGREKGRISRVRRKERRTEGRVSRKEGKISRKEKWNEGISRKKKGRKEGRISRKEGRKEGRHPCLPPALPKQIDKTYSEFLQISVPAEFRNKTYGEMLNAVSAVMEDIPVPNIHSVRIFQCKICS
jgi:hypothetical protein